jgi:hypothetical protein
MTADWSRFRVLSDLPDAPFHSSFKNFFPLPPLKKKVSPEKSFFQAVRLKSVINSL